MAYGRGSKWRNPGGSIAFNQFRPFFQGLKMASSRSRCWFTTLQRQHPPDLKEKQKTPSKMRVCGLIVESTMENCAFVIKLSGAAFWCRKTQRVVWGSPVETLIHRFLTSKNDFVCCSNCKPVRKKIGKRAKLWRVFFFAARVAKSWDSWGVVACRAQMWWEAKQRHWACDSFARLVETPKMAVRAEILLGDVLSKVWPPWGSICQGSVAGASDESAP